MLFAKITLTVVTVAYGFGPLLADLNETHLLHPAWPAHARFHGLWYLVFAALVAFLAVRRIWLQGDLLLPTSLGLYFVSAFWIAFFTTPLYGGGLADTAGLEVRLFGFEANLIVFSILTALLLATLAYELGWRGSAGARGSCQNKSES